MLYLKTAECVANSVDPDETLHFVGQACLAKYLQ